jgi:hypothetical protein
MYVRRLALLPQPEVSRDGLLTCRSAGFHSIGSGRGNRQDFEHCFGDRASKVPFI